MRTRARDVGALVLAGKIVDAASGAGIAQPGAVPFSFTRTATGVYQFDFGSAFFTVGTTVTAEASQRSCYTVGGGTFTVGRTLTATGVFENGPVSFIVTLLDKRI